MRHFWWHHAPTGRFYAVATDDAGAIVSAWVQVRPKLCEARVNFSWIERADQRGEIHKNPRGYTDALGPSRGVVQ
jgi:hypothetical protein